MFDAPPGVVVPVLAVVLTTSFEMRTLPLAEPSTVPAGMPGPRIGTLPLALGLPPIAELAMLLTEPALPAPAPVGCVIEIDSVTCAAVTAPAPEEPAGLDGSSVAAAPPVI